MTRSITKKAFTLVEMLGVLIILGIIYLIMFPNITKMIKGTNNTIDEATTEIIESATKDYLVEKSDVYPINDKYTYCIALTDLVDNANLTNQQISNLDDTNKIIEVNFKNRVPIYQLADSCTEQKSDVNFYLLGDDKITYEVGNGGQYIEQGVIAKNKAGDVVEYIIEIFNSDKEKIPYVDTTKIGIYFVKYSARIDNEDYAIERTVKVADTTAPVIQLASSKVTISVENTKYDILDGVTSSDNSGENPKISVLTNLILGQSGKYTAKYTATDSSGNSSSISREIIISSGTLIKMVLPIKELDFEANSGEYIDEPATATDENGVDVSSLIKTTIKINNKVVDSVDTSILGTYYINYSITKDNVIYSETKKVNIVDTTPPILNLIINSKTTNSIILLANASDAQSGITKYEFAINSGSYIDNGTNSSYAFTGLATGTYTLKVRVTNGAGITTETSVEASPNEIEVPTYSINPVTTYATSKTVTVTYPVRQTDFVYTYSIDGGTNWTTVASGTTASHTFTSNGSIIAKISDGINYKTASSYTVSGIDTTAPTVSLATSGMTTKTINTTATANDAQSGITKYEFAIDSGSYVNNGTTASYTFTGVTSGSHTLKVRVTNGAGTTSETSIAASPNDITAPTYSISPATTYATSKTVTVTYPVRQTDFVYTYSVDGGTNWTTVASGTTASYVFTSNGTIIARIYDGVNYKTASSYTVSGVDTTAPTVSLAASGMTTKTISVTATASDAQSGITKYEFAIDSGSYVNNGTTASYTFTGVTSGLHTLKVRVTNGAGTTSETSITSSPNDITAPTYSISPATTYATSKIVTVTYPARQTDFVYTYSVDGGTNWTTVASGTTVSYTFTVNGSIIARIYDGVNYKTASSYTVSGVDTTAPTVSLATSGMTTKTINATATANDAQSGITKYEFAIDSGSYVNNGTTASYTFTGVTSGSHTLKVRVTNGAGTTSETSITSSPNDITVPTYSISPAATYATSKIVTVTYPARQTDFVYTYSVDGGTNWTTVASGTTASYTFTSNGSIIARIYDGVNYKTASSYTVSGVDTTAPTVSLATSGMTTKTISVTASAADAQSGITKYEFAIDSGSYVNNGTTASYTFTGVTSGLHTLKVRVTNGAGTTSETSITSSPNDITAPTYSISPATTYATSKIVTVTYPARQTDFVYTYSVDGGTNWTTVASGTTASYTFTVNGSIIARIYDGVNYKTASSYTVSGVDTTAPTVSLATSGMTTKTISVTATASDAQSGITKYEFAIDSGSYVNNGTTATYTYTSVTSGSHTLKVRVTNGAGTTSETSITSSPNDITVPTYSISPASGYATSKIVTVTYPARQTDFVYTYSVDGGTNWTTVASGTTASYTFTVNGSIIARIYDGVNYKTASTYTVSGVDTTAPTVSLATSGMTTKTISVTATASDAQSGITKYEFAIDSGSYVNNGTTATYTYTSVTSGSHTLKVRVTNGAGTTSETSIAASPNDITVPTYSISPASGYATSKIVTVTYPARQTDFVYTYSVDGGTNWTTVASGTTASYTFTVNGSIIARIYDGVNYKTASTYTVSGVDTTAPTVSLATSGMTTKTISVTASAADAQSGITKYEFAIDSGSYVNNGTTATYTYTSVTSGSHTLKVRVTNGAGTTSETSIAASPNDITAPTYSISPASGYATSKTVTVTYPARQTDFVYTYSVDGGTNWTTVASGTTASYAFTSNGTIIARIYDGVNYKTASTYTVSGIDTTAPTYTSYEIKNITYYGYDVYIYGVSDSQSGVNRVQFPTWTDTNWQDDIQPDWTTNSIATGVNQGNGTWYFRVNVSAHNNESGKYNTHICWYDNVGNINYLTTVGANVPVNPYGTSIQSNYPNLYLSDNPTTPFSPSPIVQSGGFSEQNGNYNWSIALRNYLTTKYVYHETKTNLVPGSNDFTLSMNYINQWVAVGLNFRESYSLQYGNYRMRFSDGAVLNPEQAVANGYIAPLVVISGSYGWNNVNGSPYYNIAWDGFYNLKNGGTTGGSLAYAADNLGIIIFKVMNKATMKGIIVDCSNYTGVPSGIEVYGIINTFDISTIPF